MLQPYYAYHKEYDGMYSCTIYLPNNAALAVVKPVASLFALKKDDAKTVGAAGTDQVLGGGC